MKQLYIIRGLPGAGKSTLAGKIANTYHEADQYFCLATGFYQYDKEKISEAHKWCQDRVLQSMKQGSLSIAVSNTFVKRWEMEPYFKMAYENGYEAVEITLSGKLFENKHGVPPETIARMREGWEK